MSDAMIIYKATIKMLSHLIPGIVVVGIGILIAAIKNIINQL